MITKKQVIIIGVSLTILIGTAFALQANKNSSFKLYTRNEVEFQNLKYISTKTYEKITELSSDIDYQGSFKSIDLEKDSYYREQYFKLMKGDGNYINRLEEKGESDLIEFEPQNMSKYTNYYYDIHEDGIPELIVFGDRMKYEYVFSYNSQNKKIELLDIEDAGNSFFLGNNKIGAWHDGVGLTYEFYEIDKLGNKNSKIFFYSEEYLNEVTKKQEELYMVGFGEGSEKIDKFKSLAKQMGEQLFEENSTYFLRISKKQYEKITENYFKSRKKAEENIKNITYTFDYLFGEYLD